MAIILVLIHGSDGTCIAHVALDRRRKKQDDWLSIGKCPLRTDAESREIQQFIGPNAVKVGEESMKPAGASVAAILYYQGMDSSLRMFFFFVSEDPFVDFALPKSLHFRGVLGKVNRVALSNSIFDILVVYIKDWSLQQQSESRRLR